jgi:hypothetical protein
VTRLKLTANGEKTHIYRVPAQHFDFLGCQFGRFCTKTGKAYWGTRPSPRSVKRLIQSIYAQTAQRMCLLEAKDFVDNLNRKLRGWANYFKLGPVSKPYRWVDLYTKARLRRWLRYKHKIRGGGYSQYTDEYLYQRLGLVRLPALTRNLPWAKA